jgi:hypothetical protein
MSYSAGEQISWRVANGSNAGRIIRGTVVQDLGAKVTVTNFNPMDGKSYSPGRSSININKSKVIENENYSQNFGMFNNSAFQQRSRNATQNEAYGAMSGMFTQANANAKKYQQNRSRNAALNGLSDLYYEPEHVPAGLVGNKPVKKWATVQTGPVYRQGPANASSSKDPRKNMLINSSNSWYAGRTARGGSPNGASPNGPMGLTVEQRKMILQGQQALNAGLGIHSAPVNTGSTMTIAQRKAAAGLKGGLPNGQMGLTVAQRKMILQGQQALNAGLGLSGDRKEQIRIEGNNLQNGRVASRVTMYETPHNTGTYHSSVLGGKKTAPKKKPTKKTAPKKKASTKK